MKSAGNFFLVVPLHFFGCKSTVSCRRCVARRRCVKVADRLRCAMRQTTLLSRGEWAKAYHLGAGGGSGDGGGGKQPAGRIMWDLERNESPLVVLLDLAAICNDLHARSFQWRSTVHRRLSCLTCMSNCRIARLNNSHPRRLKRDSNETPKLYKVEHSFSYFFIN